MDLLKTPSVQSLLDSDLESVASLQYLDIEELDEVEYALPASEAPSLAEALSADEDPEELIVESIFNDKNVQDPATCSALQVDFLQGVSQQLNQAHERSLAGSATTLSIGKEGKLTAGTANGHILSFQDQTLRWVCDANVDRGAVSCLAYNHDGTRLLAGYARGLICQYESIRGIALRRVTLGGDLWGALRVTWAGPAGLALDTGGSVWLMKFSRPLGVRSTRASCLFSGARGEVVAMAARNARVLALATLSRVIIVAGGRAAGIRLGGPPDTLPVLEWSETEDGSLVCARSKTLQWLSVNITGSLIALRPVRRIELKISPLWLGWLGGNLAIFDADENLRLVGEDYEKPLDLAHIEPIYASAFFKGHWTDGKVSRAMCKAGVSALGGADVCDGALCLLGRQGVVRVRPRDFISRAHSFRSAGRHLQALRLLGSTKSPEVKDKIIDYINDLSERPHILGNKQVADQVVKLCVKYELREELWNVLLEQCVGEEAFVEAVGDAVVRGELNDIAPSPDATQLLLERLAEFEPTLVERVIASIPLTSLDPHRASIFARSKGLWRGVGAIAAALGGSSGAMKELVPYVEVGCGAKSEVCKCAGSALLLAAADALGGRAAGLPLPEHARPSARHDALLTLLADENRGGENCQPSPLQVLVSHEASSAIRLLEQSSREPPFVGPLGKHNRMRVAKALLSYTKDIQNVEDRIEVLEFITGQVQSGALPQDADLLKGLQQLASNTPGERADFAYLALLVRPKATQEQLEAALAVALAASSARPRVALHLACRAGDAPAAIHAYCALPAPSLPDHRALLALLAHSPAALQPPPPALLPRLAAAPPAALAALLPTHAALLPALLRAAAPAAALALAAHLLEAALLPPDAAIEHLRILCHHRPADVRLFLLSNPGLVRPEDALAVVREARCWDAEPLCLEAAGDASAAVDLLLERARGEDDVSRRADLVGEAAEVCARAARCAPPDAAADMWTRLARCAGDAPPALLLEGAAYLPAAAVARLAGESPAMARGALAAAARLQALWVGVARVAAREQHVGLVRALAGGRRGASVRGNCAVCGRALAAGDAVRTGHCARATHAHCGGEARCGGCGARSQLELTAMPAARAPRAPRLPLPPCDHGLLLLAPPRPDLEGVV